MADDGSVPFWWIVLFVLLALGLAYAAILYVGGSVTGTPAGFVHVDSWEFAAPVL